MIAFLGIYREPLSSPGRHRTNDAAILELVAHELEARGHVVALATIDAASRLGRDAAIVFSMSRSPAGLELLAGWEREGKMVVNRPDAVLNAARSRLANRRLGSLALPATHLVPTARERRRELGASIRPEGWWVKGGDLCASRREDVQRVGTMQALERALDDFDQRGITTAVLQEHVEGREIKFYAVGSAGFFHWLDSGTPPADPATPQAFQGHATEAGVELSLDIFGGDVVLGENGRMTLIDLNDWPSFAPCREPAAIAIARDLEARLAAVYPTGPGAGPSASA